MLEKFNPLQLFSTYDPSIGRITIPEIKDQQYIVQSPSNGAQVSHPENLNILADNINKQYKNLPPDMLRHVLSKESSTGTNRKNQYADVGEYGWLTGFTQLAHQQLVKEGKTPNLTTPEGSLKASADYLHYISKLRNTTDKNSLYHYYCQGPSLPLWMTGNQQNNGK